MTLQPAEPEWTTPVAVVHTGAHLDDAHGIMRDRDVSALAVIDPGGRMIGVLSMTDLLRAGRLHSVDRARRALVLPNRTVEQHMRRDLVTIDDHHDLKAAARQMVEHRVHRVFVVSDGKPTAVVSTTELAKELARGRASTPVRAFATTGLKTISRSTSLGGAIDRLADSGVRGLVVTDEGWPIGLFTQREALMARDLPAATLVEDEMSQALLCVPEATPLWRAAGHACASSARRVLTIDKEHQAVGILSGIDFARALLEGASAVA